MRIPRIEFDHERKKIQTNSRPLYKAFKSGAAEELINLGYILSLAESYGESIEPGVGAVLEVLSPFLEAAFYYEVYSWSIGLSTTIAVPTARSASTAAPVTTTVSLPPTWSHQSNSTSR